MKEHFREFLAKMKKFNLLPSWRSEEHAKECEELGSKWEWGINDNEGGIDNYSSMGRELKRNTVTISLGTGGISRVPNA